MKPRSVKFIDTQFGSELIFSCSVLDTIGLKKWFSIKSVHDYESGKESMYALNADESVKLAKFFLQYAEWVGENK